MKAVLLFLSFSILIGCGALGIAGYGIAIAVPVIFVAVIIGLAIYGVYKFFKD